MTREELIDLLVEAKLSNFEGRLLSARKKRISSLVGHAEVLHAAGHSSEHINRVIGRNYSHLKSKIHKAQYKRDVSK